MNFLHISTHTRSPKQFYMHHLDFITLNLSVQLNFLLYFLLAYIIARNNYLWQLNAYHQRKLYLKYPDTQAFFANQQLLEHLHKRQLFFKVLSILTNFLIQRTLHFLGVLLQLTFLLISLYFAAVVIHLLTHDQQIE